MIRKYLLLQIIIFGITLGEEYNNDLSQELYRYTRIVFCPNDVIYNWSCDISCQMTQGMTNLRVIESQLLEVKSFVGYQSKNNKIILSFRGSDNARNWEMDFTFLEKQYFCPGCKVHIGFLLSWLSVRHQVFESLEQLSNKYPEAEIYITGHSLGAAIASLAALDVRLNGFNLKTFYNFGCPRVGNKAFAEFFQDQILNSFRVVHYADLVPQLAPRIVGYHHFGQEVWLNQNSSQYALCDLSGEDPQCQNSLKDWLYTPNDHNNYFEIHVSC